MPIFPCLYEEKTMNLGFRGSTLAFGFTDANGFAVFGK